ncbi:citrate lyase holo-[acyl-carrier protein] synthase [Serratia microhaemolytica]|uniref:citrate lyase holo-[acyl-carrier protein] synthase n=1 Tax=Serratia microhaemolytica TaxID=2675110 RepID=UPI000FDDE159|nr:citrate lyase holo-[acyl-carrier protein] synthase [Serratia microhaemolytica]
MVHLVRELAANRAVTLPELLASRDNRQQRQQAWLAHYAAPLLVLTLVVPGAVKDSQLTRQIFNRGWRAVQRMSVQQGWHCHQQQTLALPTGCEGYLSLQADAWQIKRAAVALEQQQAVGRLWDIDVLTPEGQIISRSDIGLPERRCLLCDRPAKQCARQRTHSNEQLVSEIARIFYAAS